MDKFKSVLSGEEARREDRTILQTVNEASSLGWGTHPKGFVACFVVGAACTVLVVCLLFLPTVGLTLFIVFYTFGNICALESTMFLMAPLKQLKKMCDKTRALATTIMLGVCVLFLPTVGLTLFIVFYTLGNICALGSKIFLMGPLKELKKMCDITRVLATAIMLGVCVLFLPTVGLTLFIVFYTFGNICALGSTMFLMAPLKELKKMCDITRALATTIMLGVCVLFLPTVGLTLFIVFYTLGNICAL
ncbi:uncharacterized protein KZ484_005834 isoform 2-T2 [Pholidichthys leucotaenia]